MHYERKLYLNVCAYETRSKLRSTVRTCATLTQIQIIGNVLDINNIVTSAITREIFLQILLELLVVV